MEGINFKSIDKLVLFSYDLEHERLWKRKEEENRWLIPVAELDKVNSEIGVDTNSHLDAGNPKHGDGRLLSSE